MLRSASTLTLRLGAVALAAAAACVSVAAPAPPDADAALDNLGDGLLDGLLDKLPAPQPQAPPKAGDWLLDADAIDQRLRNAAGEDTGQPGESPMARVIGGMREAERRLGEASGDVAATPVQRQVVADLEELIAKMEKQCQGGGQCDKPSQKKQASKRSKPKPGAANKPAGQATQQAASQAPARESSTRQGSAPPTSGELAPPEDLMKAAWGHLPARVREQMLQSSSDEFLPEYREEIEAYFRLLAEREAEDAE